MNFRHCLAIAATTLGAALPAADAIRKSAADGDWIRLYQKDGTTWN